MIAVCIAFIASGKHSDADIAACRNSQLALRDKVEMDKMLKDLFGSKRFDTEHALNMFAGGFVTIPAFAIYDEEVLAKYAEITQKCHIYIVGYAPAVDFKGATQDWERINLVFTVHSKDYVVGYDLPHGATVQQDSANAWIIVAAEGKTVWPNMDGVVARLGHMSRFLDFKVVYIGQAFGEDGSRNAMDRLRKHETLQKIALKGVPAGYNLSLILIEIEKVNRMITMFNPWAKEKDPDHERIAKGLDKLVNTTEAEKTSLFEASFNRYFQPEYNKIFKDSFPSTNLKTLAACYDKDISSVIAEICIDELPYQLFSDAVEVNHYHIARHDLHKEEDRRVFFSGQIRDT